MEVLKKNGLKIYLQTEGNIIYKSRGIWLLDIIRIHLRLVVINLKEV